MEDDILGSLSTKKKSAVSKQPMSKTLPAKSTLSTNKPATKSKATFNIDDIMADDSTNLDSILASKYSYLDWKLSG